MMMLRASIRGHNMAEKDEKPALSPPKGSDPDWRRKIALAERARVQAAELRKGKPASFRPSVGHTAR